MTARAAMWTTVGLALVVCFACKTPPSALETASADLPDNKPRSGAPPEDLESPPTHIEPEKPAAEPAVEPAPDAPAAVETELVKFDGRRLRVLGRIDLDGTHEVIAKPGKEILEELAFVLKERPQITKVEIQGHRHSRMETHGQRVTKKRAETVRDHLVKLGVEPERLVAAGYADSKPIDTNRTEEGRETNTRIEIVVIEIDGKPLQRSD